MRQILPFLLGLAVAGCGTAPLAPPAPAPAPAAPPPPATPPAPTPSPTPTQVPIPPEGPGTFAVAPGGSEQIGTGQLMRYRVEVEHGIEIDPGDFAAAAETILRDPRGWTAGGKWSFQRVSDGPADFLLRLATPSTVDYICGMYWLDTDGELSCRAGEHVMINLKRWVLGVPHFDGDLATYREYLINHEVGHRLGHGHVGCPEPGGPAPVMAPQTLDLDGCRRNGWPYPDGEFLTGPPRP